jgi:CHAD domain-containing protein
MKAKGKRGTENSIQTARRILQLQFELILENASLEALCHNAKAIHDLRVAARRFRTALRVFEGPLQGTSATRIQRQLQSLNRRLGPIRDTQVWLNLLEKAARRKRASRPAAWESGLREARRAYAAQERTLIRIMKSAPGKDVLKNCGRLLDIEWPHTRTGHDPNESSRILLAEKLHQAYSQLLQAGESPTFETTEAAHAFRRRCRRARYLSEFAEPFLEHHIPKLTCRLKHVADALGAWHDAEVHAANLRKMQSPPSDLRLLISTRRVSAQKAFRVAWRRLVAPHFNKRVLAALQAGNRARN